MGASASTPEDEAREYFWLECGKTGIGFARLRVFEDDIDDEEIARDKARLAAAVPLPAKHDVFANDGRDAIDNIIDDGDEEADIEKGRMAEAAMDARSTDTAPLAALLPDAKKELLPPIETPVKDANATAAAVASMKDPEPAAVPEEDEYEEVEVEEEDDDDIKLVRQDSDFKLKAKKVVKRLKQKKKPAVATGEMSTSTDTPATSTEMGTDAGSAAGAPAGVSMAIGGDDELDAAPLRAPCAEQTGAR